MTETWFILVVLFASILTVSGGNVICKNLPIELCAFSISSMGARCVLEASETESESSMLGYMCKTSSVQTGSQGGWIEADDCMEVCGLSRMTVGLSVDVMTALPGLCSPRCFLSCPHLFHLHNLLPLAQGTPLEDVCLEMNDPRRFMEEFRGPNKHGHGGFGKRKCHGFACSSGNDGVAPSPQLGGGNDCDGFPCGLDPISGGDDDESHHGWPRMRHRPVFNPSHPSHHFFRGSTPPFGGPALAPSPSI